MATSKANESKPGTTSRTTQPENVQVTVLIIQAEALAHDEIVRHELKKKGFVLKQQTLAHLSKKDALEFITIVSKPVLVVEDGTAQASMEGDAGKVAKSAVSESATPTPRNLATGISAENIDDAVNALARGPNLVLVWERSNAISELQALVGPADVDQWPANTSTFRSRFGINAQQIGFRCSESAQTVSKEVEFLFSRTKNHDRHQTANGSSHTAMRLSSNSSSVDLTQLMNFLFPKNAQHPNSVGRLFVFALYGPLDGDSRLRSGQQGSHIVTDQELTTMSNRMEREDILAVYKMCSLSQEEEEDVLRNVDRYLKSTPRYTQRDIEQLFHNLPRDSNGKMNFHEMQSVVMKERFRRVLCMKDQIHPALAPAIRNQYKKSLSRIVKDHDNVAPVSMFLKDIGLTGAENATLVSRLLSNHSFQICHLDDGNSPSLTQNVRLLRDQIQLPHDKRLPWNPN